MFGSPICVTPFPDAGRTCADDADCAGRCIIASERLEGRSAGTAATGRCQPDDALFGCFAEVDRGIITQEICVD